MPTLTRWYLRLGLLYLAASLTLGVAVAGRPQLPFPISAMTPVYFHWFMVGWVTQLIFGVIYWMFPRASPEQPRGHPALGWAALIALNAGLLLRAVGEPMLAADPHGLWQALVLASALSQWIGGLAFVALAWGRVKER